MFSITTAVFHMLLRVLAHFLAEKLGNKENKSLVTSLIVATFATVLFEINKSF